jgi:hypothetical protein
MADYQIIMRDVVLHRDAGTENTTAGLIARINAMILAPPEVAATLAAGLSAGYLPRIEGHSASGTPLFAATAVAKYLGVAVEDVVQALQSLPPDQRPIVLI